MLYNDTDTTMMYHTTRTAVLPSMLRKSCVNVDVRRDDEITSRLPVACLLPMITYTTVDLRKC